MKKLSLVIAVATLLSSSISFAATTTDSTAATSTTTPATQIFTKDFDLKVEKEPVVETKMLGKEHQKLDIEAMMKGNSEGKAHDIGSMELSTTATSCSATITTDNGFKLQGQNNPDATLAAYKIEYTAGDKVATFDENNGTQDVGCSTADLKMAVTDMIKDAPADAYGDVIHVEVRAES
ncbi:MAG TPA: hypothetical protein ENJ51_07785 [Leucothrix mucor]|uniref:Uncharacterized protein n=1 Tax=Leucothrix mucor TaxID=45248 RepID=A0A7V2T3G3_LEUMU|nr:hypothetical protein [Leucothrix mucor]